MKEENIHMELSPSVVQIVLNALARCPYGEVAQTINVISAFVQKHQMQAESKNKAKKDN